MPSGDTIHYDYNAIEECVQTMRRYAQDIQTTTDNLENDVKRIMEDWTGTTAQAYDGFCSDLHNDLQQNIENLERLDKSLEKSAGDMQDQDGRSAKTVAGS